MSYPESCPKVDSVFSIAVDDGNRYRKGGRCPDLRHLVLQLVTRNPKLATPH